MIDVVIGIGSNIDASRHIPMAFEKLNEVGNVILHSETLITSPIGISDQPDFSNAAVLIKTDLQMQELNNSLKKLEDEMGRDRSRPKFGPREIDLDIVVYDNEIVDDDYYTRSFLQELVAQVWTKK